jgi:hypothetical protein
MRVDAEEAQAIGHATTLPLRRIEEIALRQRTTASR